MPASSGTPRWLPSSWIFIFDWKCVMIYGLHSNRGASVESRKLRRVHGESLPRRRKASRLQMEILITTRK